MRRVRWNGILVCCTGSLLVGCSAGNMASGLTSEQTVGTWIADDEFATELVLTEDGGLEATDWPEPVGCSRGDSTDLDDLRTVGTRDLEGSWASYGGTVSYQLQLSFDDEACARSGTFAYVWRDGDDSLHLCIKISPDVSSDLMRRDQIFVLHQEPVSGEETSGTC